MSNNPEIVSDIMAVTKIDEKTDIAVISWRSRVLSLAKYAGMLEVDSSGMVQIVTEDLANIKTLRDTIETKRKEIVTPKDQEVRRINLLFHELSDPLKLADETIRNKVTAYRAIIRKAEEKRVAEEQRQQAIRQQEIDQQEKQSPDIAVEQPIKPLVPVVPPIPQPKTIKVMSGSLSGRMVWKHRVVDMSALPDTYKLVNESMLKGLAKSTKGSMEIPGVEFYQDEQLSVSDRVGR